MANINDNDWQQIKHKFRRFLGKELYRATLGDSAGIIDEPSFPGYVRIRYSQQEGNLSQPTTLPFEARMIKQTGAPVIVGYDDNGDLAVLRPDLAGQRSNGTNTLGNNASDPNVSYYIGQQRIITLNSHPISSAADSMFVTIQNWVWIENGTVNYFGGGDGDDNPIDLTSYIPASADEQCIACLFIKTDNTSEVIASTPKSIAIDPDIADIQECVDGRTAGSKPVWAWRLYNGQTGITPGDTLSGGDDFLDLRQFINITDDSTGGGGGSTSVILNYEETSDLLTGGAVTQNTWTDVNSNQSFTIANGSDIVTFSVWGSCYLGNGSGSSIGSRIMIDSAGTPVTHQIGGNFAAASVFVNILGGSSTFQITGLSAGAHTIKVQMFTDGTGNQAYCRPSSNPDTESLGILIMEYS